MVNVYDSIRDGNGIIVKGRSKLFVIKTDEDGDLTEYNAGTAVVPEDSGTLFIVDQWIIDQVEKLQLIEGMLSVKDGEALDTPRRSKKELERERLMAQIAALDAEPEAVNINTADIERLTALEGIGKMKAQAILDYRESNKVFTMPAELMNVEGIGRNIFNEIQAQISV